MRRVEGNIQMKTLDWCIYISNLLMVIGIMPDDESPLKIASIALVSLSGLATLFFIFIREYIKYPEVYQTPFWVVRLLCIVLWITTCVLKMLDFTKVVEVGNITIGVAIVDILLLGATLFSYLRKEKIRTEQE